jgi:hypothetical protein
MKPIDPTLDWVSLLEALEMAESALGADPWALMMEWQQSEQLPMRGRADGVTMDFETHWFDFAAKFGCDEPMQPTMDADGNLCAVGPGKTTDRPARTSIDPKIADELATNAGPSLSTRDDILWFDQSAAIRKKLHVPLRATKVLVEMTALRRLVSKRIEQQAMGGCSTTWSADRQPVPIVTPSDSSEDPTRQASHLEINSTITAVYDWASERGMKAPNVKEIADPVLRRLREKGKIATKTRVETLAGEPHHALRRRKAGPRVYASLLPFSDLEM